MDRSSRRHERAADHDQADALTRVRLARERLRAGRREEALELAGQVPPALRIELLLDLEQPLLALTAAGLALIEGQELEPGLIQRAAEDGLRHHPADDTQAPLLLLRQALASHDPPTTLRESARDPDPLVRGEVAKCTLVAPELVVELRRDPDPYVRFMAETGGAGAAEIDADHPSEPVHTRLFGAHGPDFDMGYVVTFVASYEARLRFFSREFLRSVSLLLTGHPAARPAFGRNYGLAFARDDERPADLEAKLTQLNASGLLPFPLVSSNGPVPFDHLVGRQPGPTLSAEDERLAKLFARDLEGHPARAKRSQIAAAAPLHQRLCHAWRAGHEPTSAELEPLLAESLSRYGPVGQRAVALFVERAQTSSTRRQKGAPLGVPLEGLSLTRPDRDLDPR